ncbi:hypothetical protein V8F33_010609 [Rhypophila sp. PSN 637]
MEAVAALSVAPAVFGLLSFATTSLLLVQNFVRSQETLQTVQQEIVVLQHILEECVNVVSSHPDERSLPKSLVTALFLCDESHIALLKSLERVYSRKSRLRIMFQLSIREEELMSSYRAFRESAILLRDLTSDLRMSRQLLEVSTEIAQLLLGQDEISSDEEFDPSDRLDGASMEGERATKFRATGKKYDDGDGPASTTTVASKAKNTKARRRLERLMGARGTGGTGVIRLIPEEQRKERELTMLSGYKFVPEQEIRLEWYRPKDTQKRETTFIIADNDPPFDTLICKAEWDTEAPKAAFPIFGKKKSKSQKKEDKEAEEEQERVALELVRRQLEESSRLRDRKGKGEDVGGGSTGPPPTPAGAAS